MQEDQYRQYLDMMSQWLILKQEGKGICRYLEKRSCHTVAIYGMSVYARHIVRELQGGDIVVAYGIDRKKRKPYRGVEVFQPTGRLPSADIIINTVLHEQESIVKVLSYVTEMPVVGLDDVVFGSYE